MLSPLPILTVLLHVLLISSSSPSSSFSNAQVPPNSELRFVQTPDSIEAGAEIWLLYATEDDGDFEDEARILLRRGSPPNLRTVEVLTETATEGRWLWVVDAALESGDDYYLQLEQDDYTALSGAFTVNGNAEGEDIPADTPIATVGTTRSAAGPSQTTEQPLIPVTPTSPRTTANTTTRRTRELSPSSITSTLPSTTPTTFPDTSQTTESAAAGPLNDNRGAEAEDTENSGGLSTSASAGIGVGVSVAGAIVLLGALLHWRRGRKRRTSSGAGHLDGMPIHQQTEPAELDASPRPQEMSVLGYIPYRPGAHIRSAIS